MTKQDAIMLAIYYKKTTGRKQVIYNTRTHLGYFVGHNGNIDNSKIFRII